MRARILRRRARARAARASHLVPPLGFASLIVIRARCALLKIASRRNSPSLCRRCAKTRCAGSTTSGNTRDQRRASSSRARTRRATSHETPSDAPRTRRRRDERANTSSTSTSEASRERSIARSRRCTRCKTSKDERARTRGRNTDAARGDDHPRARTSTKATKSGQEIKIDASTCASKVRIMKGRPTSLARYRRFRSRATERFRRSRRRRLRRRPRSLVIVRRSPTRVRLGNIALRRGVVRVVALAFAVDAFAQRSTNERTNERTRYQPSLR